jgi:hypothetical protein
LRCPVDSSVFAEREGDVRDIAQYEAWYIWNGEWGA